jgi:hypothetical protein
LGTLKKSRDILKFWTHFEKNWAYLKKLGIFKKIGKLSNYFAHFYTFSKFSGIFSKKFGHFQIFLGIFQNILGTKFSKFLGIFAKWAYFQFFGIFKNILGI